MFGNANKQSYFYDSLNDTSILGKLYINIIFKISSKDLAHDTYSTFNYKSQIIIKGLCSHLQHMRDVTRILDEKVKNMEENSGKVSN
jgi:hypothetical protein